MTTGSTTVAFRLAGPRRFERVERETPQASDLADGDVLVRVEAGGICGSDLPFYRGDVPIPLDTCGDPTAGLPMHEVVGRVVERGSAADLPIGTRVVGWANDFDGLAQVVTCRATGLAAVDEDAVDAQELPGRDLVVAQPLACVVNAVDRLGPVDGARVTVLGVGPIGVLFAHVLRARGAGVIRGVDRVDRSGPEATFGFDETVRASTAQWAQACVDDATLRTDIVIEAIGHNAQTLGHAVSVAAMRGRIYYFGIPDEDECPLPIEALVRRNATLMAGYTEPSVQRASLAAALRHLRTFPDLADRYVTDVIAFDDAPTAYERACAPQPGRLKIVVEQPYPPQ